MSISHLTNTAQTQHWLTICFSSLSFGVARCKLASSGGGGICIQLYCRFSTGIPYLAAWKCPMRESKQKCPDTQTRRKKIWFNPIIKWKITRNNRRKTRPHKISQKHISQIIWQIYSIDGNSRWVAFWLHLSYRVIKKTIPYKKHVHLHHIESLNLDLKYLVGKNPLGAHLIPLTKIQNGLKI